MKWCRDMYLGDTVVSKKRRILHRLKYNKLQINVYAIVLPLGNSGILEIYPSYVFLQDIYKKQDIFIVGLASDLNEAYELVEKIVMDCYHSRNDFNITAFINERQVD